MSLNVGRPCQSFTNDNYYFIATTTDHDRELVYRNNQQPQDDYFYKRSFKNVMNGLLTEKRRWKSTSDLTSISWSIPTKVNESNQTIGGLEGIKKHMLKI